MFDTSGIKAASGGIAANNCTDSRGEPCLSEKAVVSALITALVYYPPPDALDMTPEELSWKLQHLHRESKEVADEAAAYYIRHFARPEIAQWLDESADAFYDFCEGEWDFAWDYALETSSGADARQGVSITAVLSVDDINPASYIPDLVPARDTVAPAEEIAAALTDSLRAMLDNKFQAFLADAGSQEPDLAAGLRICEAALRERCAQHGMRLDELESRNVLLHEASVAEQD